MVLRMVALLAWSRGLTLSTLEETGSALTI